MSKEIHIEQIQNYINSKSNRIFSNSNKDLYKILLKTIFEFSNEINWMISNIDKIKFFLNEDGLNLINSFINSNKKLKLIISDGNEELIRYFLNLSKNNQNFTFIKSNHEINQDILTWDNIGYRFSPDKNRLTGVACANDIEFTKKCNLIIDKFTTTMHENI